MSAAAAARQQNLYDTPPRANVSGRSRTPQRDLTDGLGASGIVATFQSPYTPPAASQRAQPVSLFSTPQRQAGGVTTNPSSAASASASASQQRSQQTAQPTTTSQTQTPTAAPQKVDGRAPETPKLGGKWIHPAVAGIEREARKFMFGEEELKRLIANAGLLFGMWWLSRKIDER
jgi:hypothetical protein